ncbi:MAG TPA: hypothetical protein VLN26_01865 [Gaiellaceae bacterium]|nr:hypothetical protein [Gaiellaceae bacterium]
MDDAQADYDELVDSLLVRHGGAERSQMMGMPCVKRGGKLALGFVRDEGALVFKLEDEEEREAALALEGAHLFDPSGKGRPFREWVVVPPAHVAEWERLGDAALGG